MAENGLSNPLPETTPEQPTVASGLAYRMKSVEEIYKTVRMGIKWAGIFGVAWAAKDAVAALAGHSTSVLAQIGLQLISDSRVTVSFIAILGCSCWAVLERRTRQKRVEQLHIRVKELELMIDPKRSSSLLTLRGQTNPGDRGV